MPSRSPVIVRPASSWSRARPKSVTQRLPWTSSEQVGRLDVAVHDAELVRVVERLGGLDAQRGGRSAVLAGAGGGARSWSPGLSRSGFRLKPGLRAGDPRSRRRRAQKTPSEPDPVPPSSGPAGHLLPAPSSGPSGHLLPTPSSGPAGHLPHAPSSGPSGHLLPQGAKRTARAGRGVGLPVFGVRRLLGPGSGPR